MFGGRETQCSSIETDGNIVVGYTPHQQSAAVSCTFRGSDIRRYILKKSTDRSGERIQVAGLPPKE